MFANIRTTDCLFVYKVLKLFKFSSFEEAAYRKDLLKIYNEHAKQTIKDVQGFKNWFIVFGTMSRRDPKLETGVHTVPGTKDSTLSSSSLTLTSSSAGSTFENPSFVAVLSEMVIDFLKSDYALDDLLGCLGEVPAGTETRYKEEFKVVQTAEFLKSAFKRAACDNFMRVSPKGLATLDKLFGHDEYVKTFAPHFFSNFEAYVKEYLNGDVAKVVEMLNMFFAVADKAQLETLSEKFEHFLSLLVETDDTLAKFFELLVLSIRSEGFFTAFAELPADHFKPETFVARTLDHAKLLSKDAWKALAAAEAAGPGGGCAASFSAYYRNFVDAMAEAIVAKTLRAKGAPELEDAYNFCESVAEAWDAEAPAVPILFAKLLDVVADTLAGFLSEITEATLGKSRLGGVLILYNTYKGANTTPYNDLYTHYMGNIKKIGERILCIVHRFENELITEKQAKALVGKGKNIQKICGEWSIDCPSVTKVDKFADEFAKTRNDIVNVEKTTTFLTKEANFDIKPPSSSSSSSSSLSSSSSVPGSYGLVKTLNPSNVPGFAPIFLVNPAQNIAIPATPGNTTGTPNIAIPTSAGTPGNMSEEAIDINIPKAASPGNNGEEIIGINVPKAASPGGMAEETIETNVPRAASPGNAGEGTINIPTIAPIPTIQRSQSPVEQPVSLEGPAAVPRQVRGRPMRGAMSPGIPSIPRGGAPGVPGIPSVPVVKKMQRGRPLSGGISVPGVPGIPGGESHMGPSMPMAPAAVPGKVRGRPMSGAMNPVNPDTPGDESPMQSTPSIPTVPGKVRGRPMRGGMRGAPTVPGVPGVPGGEPHMPMAPSIPTVPGKVRGRPMSGAMSPVNPDASSDESPMQSTPSIPTVPGKVRGRPMRGSMSPPGVPTIPKTQSPPGVPTVPGVPGIPSVPGVPSIPTGESPMQSTPSIPTVPGKVRGRPMRGGMRGAPTVPGVPGVPSVPTGESPMQSTPSIPTVPGKVRGRPMRGGMRGAPTVPGVPGVPGIPSVPGGEPHMPMAPSIPTVPGKVRGRPMRGSMSPPGVPTIPKTQSPPGVPTLSGAPTVPTIPGAPAVPTIPGAPPTISGAPAVPTIPGAPPTIPGAPAVPTIPGAPPTIPGAPAVPMIPGAPIPPNMGSGADEEYVEEDYEDNEDLMEYDDDGDNGEDLIQYEEEEEDESEFIDPATLQQMGMPVAHGVVAPIAVPGAIPQPGVPVGVPVAIPVAVVSPAADPVVTPGVMTVDPTTAAIAAMANELEDENMLCGLKQKRERLFAVYKVKGLNIDTIIYIVRHNMAIFEDRFRNASFEGTKHKLDVGKIMEVYERVCQFFDKFFNAAQLRFSDIKDIKESIKGDTDQIAKEVELLCKTSRFKGGHADIGSVKEMIEKAGMLIELKEKCSMLANFADSFRVCTPESVGALKSILSEIRDDQTVEKAGDSLEKIEGIIGRFGKEHQRLADALLTSIDTVNFLRDYYVENNFDDNLRVMREKHAGADFDMRMLSKIETVFKDLEFIFAKMNTMEGTLGEFCKTMSKMDEKAAYTMASDLLEINTHLNTIRVWFLTVSTSRITIETIMPFISNVREKGVYESDATTLILYVNEGSTRTPHPSNFINEIIRALKIFTDVSKDDNSPGAQQKKSDAEGIKSFIETTEEAEKAFQLHKKLVKIGHPDYVTAASPEDDDEEEDEENASKDDDEAAAAAANKGAEKASTVIAKAFNEEKEFSAEAIRTFCSKAEKDYEEWTGLLKGAAEEVSRLKFLNNLQVLSLAHILAQCSERSPDEDEMKRTIRYTMNVIPYVLLCFPEVATEVANSEDIVNIVNDIVGELREKIAANNAAANTTTTNDSDDGDDYEELKRRRKGANVNNSENSKASIDAACRLMKQVEQKLDATALLRTAAAVAALGSGNPEEVKRPQLLLHVLGEQGSTPDKLYDCLEAIFQGPVHESFVLSCTEETSAEDMGNFLGRVAVYDDPRAVFALTHVNTVPLAVKEYLLEWARSVQGCGGALHVIFTAARGSELFTDAFQSVDNVDALRESLRRKRQEQAAEQPDRTAKQLLRSEKVESVYVYDSGPLSGKTTKIREQMKEDSGRIVTVSVMEGFHPRECIKYLRKAVFNADFSGEDVALHLNVSPYAPLERFGEFLYAFLRWGLISDQRSGSAMYMGPNINWHVYVEIGVAPPRDDECAFTSTKAVRQMLPLLDPISDVSPPPTEFNFSDEEVKNCAAAFCALNSGDIETYDAYNNRKELIGLRGGEHFRPFVEYLETKSRFFAIRSRLARLMADRYRSLEQYLDGGDENGALPGSIKTFPQLVRAMNAAIDEEVSQYTTSPLKGFTRFINFPAGSEPIIMDFAQESQHQDPGEETLGVMSLSEVCKDVNNMYAIVSAAFKVDVGRCRRALETKNYVLTPDFALKLMFLNQCRRAGQNVVLSGDTGTGKSELLETFTRLINLNTDAIPDVFEHLKETLAKGVSGITNRDDLLRYVQEKFEAKRLTASNIFMAVQNLYRKYSLRKKPLVRRLLKAGRNNCGNVIDRFDDVVRVIDECLSAEVKLFHKVLMDQHITAEIFTSRVEKAMKLAEETAAKSDGREVTVMIGFIDECTSTRIMGMVKEVLIDKTINGRALPPNMMWIGAFNRNSMPNEEALLAKSGVQIKDFTGVGTGEALDFAVRPPPESLEILEVCFSRLNAEQQRFFLNKLLCLQSKQDQLNEQGQELCDAIIYAHGYVDEKRIQRVHPSIRDFVRVTGLYDYFCRHPCYFFDDDDDEASGPGILIPAGGTMVKVASAEQALELHKFALVLAVTISYYFRMPHTLRPEFARRYVEGGLALPAEASYAPKHKGGEDDKDAKTYSVEAVPGFAKDDPFLKIFRYTALRLYENTEYKKGVAATESFLENLFCTVVCIDAKIPLMIVGPPGCSKTLSFSLAMQNMKGHQSRSPFYRKLSYVHPTRYQCSRDSTDKEIQDVYNIAIDQQRGYDEANDEARKAASGSRRKSVVASRRSTVANNTISSNTGSNPNADSARIIQDQRCVVLLDEAGLPDERTAPLKILHYVLDHPKVSSIILSNCILDAAKTNRTALLIQDAPNDEDMQALVRVCVYGDTLNLTEEAHEVIRTLAESYKNLLKAQTPEPAAAGAAGSSSDGSSDAADGAGSQRNGATKIAPIPEFFHLRDFVYFLRYLGREVKEKRDPMDPVILVRALRRNFGGVEESMFREVVGIFGESANMMTVEPQRRRADYIDAIAKTSVIDSLRESLNEEVAEDEDVNMAPVRFVLVVDPSDSEVAVSILFDQKLCDKSATDICHIADFAEDSTESARENAIIRVKNAMEDNAGKTMILMNPMPISSSFYDVFNRHFDVIKTKDGKGFDYFARIAIGSYSRPCVVSPRFKLIVHLPLSLLKRTPAPFLNRFEKYYLSLGNLLGDTLAKLKPSGADVPLTELAYGAKDMTSRFGGRETFFGLVPEETINSLVLPIADRVHAGDALSAAIPPLLHINDEIPNAGDDDDDDEEEGGSNNDDPETRAKRRNIRKLNYLLLQLARPECILELAKGPLPASYLREYVLAQEHFSLARTLQRLTAKAAATERGAQPMKWCIFTRASAELTKLRSSAALRGFLFGGLHESLHVVQLEYLTSTRECEREVETADTDVLVCLANMQKCTSDQTSFARTLIDSSKVLRRLVVFILYYPPEMQVQDSSQVCQAVFFNSWNYLYVDSLGAKPDGNGGYQLIDSFSWLANAYSALGKAAAAAAAEPPSIDYFRARIVEQIAALVRTNPRAPLTQSVLELLPYSAAAYKDGVATTVENLTTAPMIMDTYARRIYDAWCNGFVGSLLDAECTAIQEGRQHYGIFEGLDRCLTKLFLPAARVFLETFCADLSLEAVFAAFDQSRDPTSTQAETAFVQTVLNSASICDADELRATSLAAAGGPSKKSRGAAGTGDNEDDDEDEDEETAAFLGTAFTTPSYLPLFSIVYKRVRAVLAHVKETCQEEEDKYTAIKEALARDPAVAAVEAALAANDYLRTLYGYDLVVWGFHLPELYVPPSVLAEQGQLATLWLDICSRCISFFTFDKTSIIEMHLALELFGKEISALLGYIIPLHALAAPPTDFGDVPSLLAAPYSQEAVAALKYGLISFCVNTLGANFGAALSAAPTSIVNLFVVYRDARARGLNRTAIRALTSDPTHVITLDVLEIAYLFSMYLANDDPATAQSFASAILSATNPAEYNGLTSGLALCTMAAAATTSPASTEYRLFLENVLLHYLDTPPAPEPAHTADVELVFRTLYEETPLTPLIGSPVSLAQFLAKWLEAHSAYYIPLLQVMAAAPHSDPPSILAPADAGYLLYTAYLGSDATAGTTAAEKFAFLQSTAREGPVYPAAITRAALSLVAGVLRSSGSDAAALDALKKCDPSNFARESFAIVAHDDVKSVLLSELRDAYKILEVCSWENTLGYLGLSGLFSEEAHAKCLKACMLPQFVTPAYSKIDEASNGSNSISHLFSDPSLSPSAILTSLMGVSYYSPMMKEVSISILQLLNSMRQSIEITPDIESAFMFVSRKDSMDKLFKTLSDITPHASWSTFFLSQLLSQSPTSTTGYSTSSSCKRTGTDCGIYMDKYGNIGQNDDDQEILESNRVYRICYNLLSWACMCWALALGKYTPENKDSVFTMYKNFSTGSSALETKIMNYAVSQLSRHFEELTKNVFTLMPNVDPVYFLNLFLDDFWRANANDRSRLVDYSKSLSDTYMYENVVMGSFRSAISSYSEYSGNFFGGIDMPAYTQAAPSPFVNANSVHSYAMLSDNPGLRLFVDFFMNALNEYPLYKKLPLLVKFYCELHDVLDGNITEAEASDFTLIQAISKYDTTLRVMPMWPAFRELWAEAIDVMKVPGLPKIDDYTSVLDAIGTEANPGGPIFTLIEKGFAHTQNRILTMRDQTKSDPSWNPMGMVFESNGSIIFLDEFLYENVNAEDADMFSLIHLINSSREKNLEFEAFSNVCTTMGDGENVTNIDFVAIAKQAVQRFTQNKFRVAYKPSFKRVCKINYSVGSFLDGFDPMNSVKSLDVYISMLTGSLVGDRMDEAQEKDVIKELTACTEEVLVALSEVMSSTLCYFLKTKHDESLLSSSVDKSIAGVYKDQVSSAGVPPEISALERTMGLPLRYTVHVSELLLNFLSENRTMFKDFDQSYKLLMPLEQKKMLESKARKMIGSPFNELVLYKKSFSALFKILCSVKNSMLRPSVQIKEIFADELRHLKVEYAEVLWTSKVLDTSISYFSGFMVWLNNFVAALKTKVRKEANKNVNVKYKEIVIGKPSMLTYNGEVLYVEYNKKFKKVLKDLERKSSGRTELMVVSSETKCESTEDDRFTWTSFNVIPVTLQTTVTIEIGEQRFRAVKRTVTPKGILMHMRKDTGVKLRIAGTSKTLLDNETFAALRPESVIQLEEAGEWKSINVWYNGVAMKIPGNVPFESLGEYFKEHDPQMAFCFVVDNKTPIQMPGTVLLDTINRNYGLKGLMYIADYPKAGLVDLLVYPAEKVTQNAVGSTYYVPCGVKATEVISIFRRNTRMKGYNMFEWNEQENVIGPLINYSNRHPIKLEPEEGYKKHFQIQTAMSVIVKKE